MRRELEMEESRTVLCPHCGHTNTSLDVCRRCKQPMGLDPNDYSPPTSIHERYRCTSYPARCVECVHGGESDTFCHDGKIDIRRMRRQYSNGDVVYIYKDWVEK